MNPLKGMPQVAVSVPIGATTQGEARPEIALSANEPAEQYGKGGKDASHRKHSLGPFLCWAVVFADIGTSVYYTPGILYLQVGIHAALFVIMTMAVFLLLSLKYAEVTVRYPEGGGVVTVGTRALHPFVGLVGGMFILVDYFLTAALSAVSGIGYMAFVAPALNNNKIEGALAIGALIVLGLLNWVGISESAKVSAIFATVAFASQGAIVVAVLAHIGIGHAFSTVPQMLSGRPHLGPVSVLTGYAGAFLAFSGLESISQLSPVMRTPRRRVARLAMGAVVATIGLTSPFLTLWSTTLLSATTIKANASSNALLSLLADATTGRWLGVEVAISGAILLVFACNTAIIGTYHVFLALSRMRFFPEFIERRNRLRGTPHFAILLAVGIPILILIPASLAPDTQGVLGDLYAFGLLGAFSVTCLSLDVVRWRERHAPPGVAIDPHTGEPRGEPQTRAGREPRENARRGRRRHLAGRIYFGVGVLTTVLVILAWSINLVHKLPATFFGGSVTVVGLVVALLNYSRLSRRGMAVAFPAGIRTALRDAVLVVLPQGGEGNEGLVRAAAAAADGRPVVFLYRGAEPPRRQRPGLFEVVDPYLDDRLAQDTFGRIERLARRLVPDRRYVYVPASDGLDAVTRVWQRLQPRDTLALAGDESALRDIAVDRVRRPAGRGVPIVHYLKHWEPVASS